MSVRGIRVVDVDLLVLTSVQAREPLLEELCRFCNVVVRPFVVWKVSLYTRVLDFALENVRLVHEQDDRCVHKPLRVADLVE